VSATGQSVCQAAISLSVCQAATGLSVCQTAAGPSVCQAATGLSVCQTATGLSVCQSVCQTATGLSVCQAATGLSVCQSVCQTATGQSVCQSVRQLSVCQYVRQLPARQSVRQLSVCQYVRQLPVGKQVPCIPNKCTQRRHVESRPPCSARIAPEQVRLRDSSLIFQHALCALGLVKPTVRFGEKPLLCRNPTHTTVLPYVARHFSTLASSGGAMSRQGLGRNPLWWNLRTILTFARRD
jgi:hypothetical protein